MNKELQNEELIVKGGLFGMATTPNGKVMLITGFSRTADSVTLTLTPSGQIEYPNPTVDAEYEVVDSKLIER